MVTVSLAPALVSLVPKGVSLVTKKGYQVARNVAEKKNVEPSATGAQSTRPPVELCTNYRAVSEHHLAAKVQQPFARADAKLEVLGATKMLWFLFGLWLWLWPL